MENILNRCWTRVARVFILEKPATCIAVRDMDLRRDIGKITAPTLIISGTCDVPTPPADGRFLQQQIPGARCVELAAAHISNQEQAVPFTDAVLQFFDWEM